MREVWLAKQDESLIPIDDESRALIRRLEDGECKAFKPIGVRDLVAHRRYWAMCTQTARCVRRIEIDRQDGKPVYLPIKNKDHAHTAFKLCTGLYDVLPVEGTDYAIRVPHSTRFDEMTSEEWADYWPQVLGVLLDKVAPEIEVPEARTEMLKCVERWSKELS